MPIADEVVVQLEAKNKQYIADLEAARKKFNEHQNNILKKAGMGTPEFQKAQKKRVDSHRKAVTQISRQQKKINDAIVTGSKLQARATEEGTSRIVAALRAQREGQVKTAKATTDSTRLIRRALAAVSLTVLTRETFDYADSYVELTNKIAAASVVADLQGRSVTELGRTARGARADIEPYVDLYARLLRSSKGIADSELEVARATELASKAFTAGGASAQEQAAGILQLGQALGSGFLQGDELRSIRENAPLVAKAIADSVGVSIGELKKLGAEGELTSDIVFRALLNGADDIEAAFAATVPKATDATRLAFDNLRIKIGEYAAESGAAHAVNEDLAGTLDFLANNVDLVADTLIVAGAAAAGFFGTRGLIAATTVSRNLVKELAFVNVMAGRSAFSLKTAGSAAKFFIASLGPIGIATAAITAAAAAFALLATDTSKADASYKEFEGTIRDLERTRNALKSDEGELKRLLDQTTESIEAQGAAAIAARDAEIGAISDRISNNKKLLQSYEAIARAQLDAGRAETQAAQKEIIRLAGINRRTARGGRGGNAGALGFTRAETDEDFKVRAAKELEAIIDGINAKSRQGIDLSKKELEILKKRAELEQKKGKIESDKERLKAVDAALNSGALDIDDSDPLDTDSIAKYRDLRLKAEAELAKAQELNSQAEIERAEKRLAITERTLELLGQGVGGAQAARIAKDEAEPKGKRRSGAASQLERQIKAIEELGRSEREQINDLLALRLDAIEKSKRAEGEKADLRQKAHDAAAADIAELNDKERKLEQDRADAQFNHEQDRLDAIADIQAAVLRMSGRALEAAEVEAAAVKRRYEEELRLIDEIIAKKGLTPELASQRAQAQAGIAGADEEQSNISAERKDALEAARGLVGGNRGEESELDRGLRDIAEDERARLQELEDLRAGDLENLAEFEAIKTQIVADAHAERLALIKESREAALAAQINQAQQSLSVLKNNLKEGSKAQKIAARAEQAIAIGKIAVSTATGAAEALKGPFPLNLINAALVVAAGGAQAAAAAAPSFDGGGRTPSGPRSGGLDGKGGFMALLHPNETIIDNTRPNAPIAGKSLVDGLGLSLPSVNVAAPNVSIPALPNVTNSSTSSNFVGGDFVVQGNLDAATADSVMAEFRRYQQNEAQRFRKMSEQREKRTTPRSRRSTIGGR